MKPLLASLLITLLISGCMVGPDYKRPAAIVPTEFRGASRDAAVAEAASLGDQKWWDVFRDEQLQSLIRTAIQQNYDVRIAATHVLQAQAQLGITRSNQFPSVSAGADIAAQRTAQSIVLPAGEQSRDKYFFPPPGNSISGDNIAALRKPLVPRYSLRSGADAL